MQELCLSDQNFLFLTLQEYGKCSFVIWLSYYKLCHFILSEFSVFSGLVVNLSWVQTMFYLVREIVVIRHFLIATETTILFLEIFVLLSVEMDSILLYTFGRLQDFNMYSSKIKTIIYLYINSKRIIRVAYPTVYFVSYAYQS